MARESYVGFPAGAGPGVRLQAAMREIGVTGAVLDAAASLRPGVVIPIVFDLPGGNGRTIQASAKVVSSTPSDGGGHLVEVGFASIAIEDRLAILEFLKSKRKHPRKEISEIPATVIAGGKPASGGIRNLSVGGISLEAAFAAAPGETYQLFFTIPDPPKLIRAACQVRQVEVGPGGRSRLGMEFIDLSEEGKAYIREFLDSLP